MGKQNIETATGADVRAWAREDNSRIPEGASTAFLGETARGRLPKAVIEAFEADTGKVYVKGAATGEGTVSFDAKVKDKSGRKRTKRVTMTVAEARETLGQPASTKGRVPVPALRDAWLAANGFSDVPQA